MTFQEEQIDASEVALRMQKLCNMIKIACIVALVGFAVTWAVMTVLMLESILAGEQSSISTMEILMHVLYGSIISIFWLLF